MKKILLLLMVLLSVTKLSAEDGYDLWLRYKFLENKKLLHSYQQIITGLQVTGNSPTIQAAKEEFLKGVKGITGFTVPHTSVAGKNGTVIISTYSLLAPDLKLVFQKDIQKAGVEGFIINSQKRNGKTCTLITGNTDISVLYGVFHFLRLIQTEQSISNLHTITAPKLKLRLLNHWDNLNRTVERGYAGFSIWNWHTLPGYIGQRYIDYARVNASIGIN